VSKGKDRRNRQPIPARPAAQPRPGTQLAPTPASLQRAMLGYDPTGKSVPLDVVSSKVNWSEYELDDGTIVRIKGVLIDVKKAVDQYAPDGKPIYITQMTMVPDFVVPDKLMKKTVDE